MPQDITSLIGQIGALLTALGAGALLARIVDGVFGRANKKDDLAVGLRSEMVSRLADQERRLNEMDEKLEASRQQNNTLIAQNARLEAENEALRERYHGLRNIMQILLDRDRTYRERLGLPPDEIDLPAWLYQRVPGPTARESAQKPPEATP
jgi:hypothetical protein